VDDAGKHIHGLENFSNQAQRILRQYDGIPRNNFELFIKELFIKELFIKECEFRFNYGTTVVPKVPKSNYGCSNVGPGRRG
jgi:transposase